MRYKLKPLTEIAVFRTPHMSMAVHSERNYVGNAYFKLGDNIRFENAVNKTRILFDKDDYVFHLGDIWVLNTKELDIMIEFLLSQFKTKHPKFKYLMNFQINNWKAGMFIYNDLMCGGSLSFEYFAQLSRKDPDYNPKYIPIADVKFPLYENLSRYKAFKKKG